MDRIEFWPALCQLAEAYDQQGLNADERISESVRMFARQPRIVQRQIIEHMLRLSMDLPDLYAAVVAAANGSMVDAR
jgi:hypothetical protein